VLRNVHVPPYRSLYTCLLSHKQSCCTRAPTSIARLSARSSTCEVSKSAVRSSGSRSCVQDRRGRRSIRGCYTSSQACPGRQIDACADARPPLARRVPAYHTAEDILAGAGGARDGPEGYLIAYGIAADNLRLGHTVIADCVNPVAATRRAWRAVASEQEVACINVEIVCSEEGEHRSRVESRGTAELCWADVLQRSYDTWEMPRLVLDTAGQTPAQSYVALLMLLKLESVA
jgi:predicted kinase